MESLIVSRLRDMARAWLLPEVRSSLENPSTPLSYPAEWLLDIFNGGRTDSGIRVSEMTALQVSTVFACVQLISSTLGALPLHVYELITRQDKRLAKRLAHEHDAYDLLRYEPNQEMTALTFRKTLQAHMLLWGNGYAEIQRDAGNRPLAIWPRNPARTRPYRLGNGVLVYKTSEGTEEQTEVYDAAPAGPERTIEAEDMLHIPGLALDGRLGQSVIQLARQAVGLALATEKYGAKYFGNGARPGGVLEHPGKLTPQARETLKRSWQEAQGGENAHRVAVLEEGMKWQEAANKPEEAQFLQTREFQKSDICSIFAVPPHMIGMTEKQNRANTEQIALEFLTFTIGPWIEAWEQETRRKLFASIGRAAGKYFPKFETRRLVMPDADSRRNFYASGKQWGYLCTNDILVFEDMNPVDDPSADAYWMPINMTEMGKEPPAPPVQPKAAGEPQPQQQELPDNDTRLIRAFSPLFRDAMRRILSRERADSAAFRNAFECIFCSLSLQLADERGAEEFELSSRFITDYLRGMGERLPLWRSAGAGLGQLADTETARAVEAIRGELGRATPAAPAKELVEV